MRKIIFYNKLIRDNIPKIARERGEKPYFRKIKNKEEFLKEIKRKIREEANEMIRNKSEKGVIDEIIDIQELLDVLTKEIGLTKQKITKEQNKKRRLRGGFKKKLFLVKVKK